MNEFKVGDEVEVLGISVFYKGNIEVGDVATIVRVDGSAGLFVKCNNKVMHYWVLKSDVKLVTTKYPNSPHKHCDLQIEKARGAMSEKELEIEVLSDSIKRLIVKIENLELKLCDLRRGR